MNPTDINNAAQSSTDDPHKQEVSQAAETNSSVSITTGPNSAPDPNHKNNKVLKIVLVVLGVIICIIAIVVILFFMVFSTSKKLVCESSEGSITLMYDDKTITGYTASDIGYNFSEQSDYAEEVGIDNYLSEFSTWFNENTSGTCKKQ